MAVYTLRRTQIISATLQECWAFFSDARNLARITPPSLGFEVLTELPPEVYPGLMIEYRVRPLFGIPMTWVSEITHVRAPHSFVDDQRVGPYSLWHHEHSYRELGDGRVECTDLVHYAPPFGPLGALMHPWLIAPRLAEIFDYRTQVLGEVFPAKAG